VACQRRVLRGLRLTQGAGGADLWLLCVQGESYAGMYVPTLALQVLEHNTEHDAAKAASLVPDAPKINLKGILVGNGTEYSNDFLCDAIF
jgi:carboxypeptidase C (cathepsin A)